MLIGNRCFVDRKRVLFCYVTCHNSPLDVVKWTRLLPKWALENVSFESKTAHCDDIGSQSTEPLP